MSVVIDDDELREVFDDLKESHETIHARTIDDEEFLLALITKHAKDLKDTDISEKMTRQARSRFR